MSLGILDETSGVAKSPLKSLPIRGMRVFAHIDAVVGKQWIEDFERGDLIRIYVARVIDHDVDAAHFGNYSPKQSRVGLIADMRNDPTLCVAGDPGFNVEAMDDCISPEIGLPDLK